MDTTTGADNVWATGTHFSLKYHIFGIVISSREPVLTELIFLFATLFHFSSCRLQRVKSEGLSFAGLFMRWKTLQIHLRGA